RFLNNTLVMFIQLRSVIPHIRQDQFIGQSSTMGSHLRIEKRLIDKRFIFFRISIAVSCFSAFFLILLTKVSRHYITREIAPLHPFSNIFVITDKGKE